MSIETPVAPAIPLAKPIFITGSDFGGKGYVYDMLKRHPQIFWRHKQWYWSGYHPKIQRMFETLDHAETRQALICYHLESLHQENQVLFPDIFQGSATDFSKKTVGQVEAYLSDNLNHDVIFSTVLGYVSALCGKSFFMQLATGQYIQRLAKHLPQAKFLAIIRDPRNMLVSRKTRRKNVWTSPQFTDEQRPAKHFMSAYDPLWDSFSAKSDIRAMQRALEALPQQMKLFHHPKLTAAPESGARAIATFIKMPFHSDMLKVQRRSSSKWDDKKKQPSEQKPRFVHMLHPCEIALSQRILAKELKWLGYQQEPISRYHSLLSPLLLFRSVWDLWLRIFRRWSYRGTPYLLDMFRMYFRRFRSIWRT